LNWLFQDKSILINKLAWLEGKRIRKSLWLERAMKQKEKECKTMLLALFSSTETLEAYAIVWAPTTYP